MNRMQQLDRDTLWAMFFACIAMACGIAAFINEWRINREKDEPPWEK